MVRVLQADAADTALPGDLDRPRHRELRVEQPDSTLAVPLFYCTEPCDQLRFGFDIDRPVVARAYKPGKAIEAVRDHTVARILSE